MIDLSLMGQLLLVLVSFFLVPIAVLSLRRFRAALWGIAVLGMQIALICYVTTIYFWMVD